jgi:DNA-directed RNA polymerase subunit RPC12/RpoP
MSDQIMHNGLNTRSRGKGREGKVAPCGVPLTRANSAQKLSDITCQRCLSSLAVRDRDTADVRRDAAKSARNPRAAKL